MTNTIDLARYLSIRRKELLAERRRWQELVSKIGSGANMNAYQEARRELARVNGRIAELKLLEAELPEPPG